MNETFKYNDKCGQIITGNTVLNADVHLPDYMTALHDPLAHCHMLMFFDPTFFIIHNYKFVIFLSYFLTSFIKVILSMDCNYISCNC